MMKISELLIIMSGAEQLFKKHCNSNGLCKLSRVLYDYDHITWDERLTLTRYIDDNRPARGSKHFRFGARASAFYWPEGAWEPRKAWLDTQIKKQLKREKTNIS